MKIRTKFLAAVLAATMTLGCALTASAFKAEPKLSLQGNESSPLTLKNQAASATLTLKASDFKEVKGAKITVELPDSEKMELTGITVSDVDSENVWNLQKDVNYKVSGNKITMVDVFNFANTVKKANLNLNLTFDVAKASIGTYAVKVSGDFADDAADKVYPVTANANLVIGREEASATNLDALNSSISADNNYFIPYGGAYKGDINLPKSQDGTFSLAAGVTANDKIGLLKCKLPVGKAVTTFGVSKGLENFTNDGATAIQFGSYVNEVVSGYTYGTLFIAPGTATFEEAVKYYKENTQYTTEAAILERFIQILTTNKAKAKELHTIKFNNKTQSIKVAYVPQSNYMWKDAAKGEPCSKLQYAVRYKLTSEKLDTVYTAVGYSCDTASNNYNFSTEIKSSSYNAMP